MCVYMVHVVLCTPKVQIQNPCTWVYGSLKFLTTDRQFQMFNRVGWSITICELGYLYFLLYTEHDGQFLH